MSPDDTDSADDSLHDTTPHSPAQTWGALGLWALLFAGLLYWFQTKSFEGLQGQFFEFLPGQVFSLTRTAMFVVFGIVIGSVIWLSVRIALLVFQRADSVWVFVGGIAALLVITGASAVEDPQWFASSVVLATVFYQMAGVRIATYRNKQLALDPRGKAGLVYWLIALTILFVVWGDHYLQSVLVGAHDEWTANWMMPYQVVVLFTGLFPLVVTPLLFQHKDGSPTWAQTWPRDVLRLLLPFLLISAVVFLMTRAAGSLPLLPIVTDNKAFPAGDEFQDCVECPVMVIIPLGSFERGAAGEGERLPQVLLDQFDDPPPQRPINATGSQEVRFTRPFAVAKFEVTFDQWDACVREGGCDVTGQEAAGGDAGWGRGNRPLIFVDWTDAKQYADWLSDKTNGTYRLLRDVEWEYSAKAGTETNFPWGDEPGENNMNYRWGDEWPNTAPVGSFPPNSFGLHDMHGNVWEWTGTCEKSVVGNCPQRIVRGGSWRNRELRGLESAARFFFEIEIRQNFGGFRVLKELE